mmetsp:Transcript_44500/g.72580  ORF Transcript_44500/g.72580 Transcript_44500/m.72580 type:complete len:596 (-) Transcript_44500:346-2133(-)|eukprot:CAMPEP_0206405954 /NCGR_PEP_ID=MMETSP0294-20121207/29431_1 /ASSEMBLY_ACC=CAM_ASM_000327 /TAXON_ID=39354 /ORGANISM="Heterosigma akashiwo, Strain CCMP2393" /LENGTH=595 /DNA_ID=CAMNT_0053864461 /DNA_START=37 /DNA_END=1824 /DNA_ORIENTATION=+
MPDSYKLGVSKIFFWILFWLTWPSEGFFNTSLSISPAEQCQPLEIEIKFVLNTTLDVGDSIYIKTPGLTSGACENEEGGDLDLVYYTSSNIPDDTFTANFYEGTVADQYNSSYIQLYLENNNLNVTSRDGKPYKIYIDKQSQLKVNCLFSTAEIKTDASSYNSQPYQVFDELLTTVTGAGCYITDTLLDFTPSQPGKNTKINISFVPAFPMTEGDLVTVNLGGFTTGNLSTNGSDLSMGAVVFASGYNPLFGGQWTEGEFVSQEMGFYNSTLRVTLLNTSYAAGDTVSIIVARSTGIRAQCGIDGATPHWWLKVEAAAANTSLTYFDTTEAVGPGCRHLSYCSDAGTCDYCLQKCTCYEGFGATTDIADIDISLDCSEKVCPAGPAFGHLPASSTDGHAPRECSAAGACNRNTGECLCFTGWWGRACERHECPSSEGIACSGHGRCFKMKDLAKFSDAMPLSNRNTSNATIEYWGMDADGTLADSVWDAEMGSGCVCDSSWEVGLESNQTQAAEWFGPACELRRCPSGDDPMTSEIDEEDCEGVAAAGGRGVGKEGNRCHHECAGRGTCDYTAGLCSCFPGFYGHNCALKDPYNS